MIDPRNQFLLSMGANLMGQPYSPTPQGTFGGLGNAMNQGMGAFQNAMVIQQAQAKAQAEAEAKKAELERLAKARQQLQNMVSSLPSEQQNLVLQRFDSDPKGTMEYLMELAMPKPTADMQNFEATVKRLEGAGVTLTDEQKTNLYAGWGQPHKEPPPGMTVTNRYNPETGSFETVVGPGESNATGSKAISGAQEQAQQDQESLIFRDVIGEIISDPNFDNSVGPIDSIRAATTGKLTDSKEYQLRERLIKTVQPRVMQLGGLVLKGSQTEKEWEMVRDTMPSPSDHPSVWKQWYRDFSRVEAEILRQKYGDEAYEAAMANTKEHLSNAPISHEEAIRTLKEGDEYIGPDGRKYRLQRK